MAPVIEAHLGRVLRSPAFAHSERMARFLSYVVREWLAGRAERLKEYAIGIEVFDRRESYDPRIDPIVRVEARRLRAKLQQYYELDGSSDELRLDLPKGSYVPRVAWMSRPKTRNVISVAPFNAIGPDDDCRMFRDGLLEELIERLTKVASVRVSAGNTGAFHLTGAVRRDRDRVRVTAQLLDAATDFYLWSERYEGDMRKPLACQEAFAISIAGAVKSTLGCRPSPLHLRLVPGQDARGARKLA
jgi:serine/threonine-protein kinase